MPLRLLDERDLEAIKSGIAIKGNLSGQIVRADDVSAMKHEVAVRVRPKNLFDISQLEITSIKESEHVNRGCISNVTSNSITITTYEGHTSNAYTISKKTLSQVCPELKVGDEFVLSAETESANKYIYLSTPHVGVIEFNKKYVVTKEMLESGVVFYGLNVSSGNQGVGECVISNIQIEIGDTATDYTPYVDPSTVKVRRCGKNLLFKEIELPTTSGLTYTKREDGGILINGTASERSVLYILSSGKATAFNKGKYTFSIGNKLPSGCTVIIEHYNDGGWAGTLGRISEGSSSATIDIPGTDYTVACYLEIKADTTVNNLIVYPQLEFGEEATEFNIFNGDDYSPLSDGTIEGVTSISHAMTLHTYTDNAIVECEYIKDTGKVIEKLTNAIIALGGTV